MWTKFRTCASALLLLLTGALAGVAAAQPVVPNTSASVEGPGETNEPFHNTALTIQYYIHRSQVPYATGTLISGMAWRIEGSDPTYSTAMNFSQYDVQFSQSDTASYNLGSLNSNTFASNMAGTITTVRSGALSVGANSLAGGMGGTPNTNPFSYYITFSTPYSYVSGTDIVITIRHSTGPAAPPQLDSINGSFGVCWCKYGSGAAATTAIIPNAGFCIMNLQIATASPEVGLSHGGIAIPDGSTDTLGSGWTAGTPLNLIYTVVNTGNATLTVGTPGVSGQANCTASLTASPATSVGAGSSTTFTVTVTPSGAGGFSCNVAFTNNDSNENPYNFTITGTAGGTAAPEIAMAYAPFALTDGGTAQAFGSSAGVSQVLQFTVYNNGTANLTIAIPGFSNFVNCSAFISTFPASTVAPGGNTGISITLTPTAAGAFSCDVSFANNDANENPFNWMIYGNANPVATAPEMDLFDNLGGLLTQVADGGTLNLGDQATGVALDIEFYVMNYLGTGTLNLMAINIVGQNCTVAITVMPASAIAAGDDTNFIVRVTPLADGAFSFTMSIDNDDADENPYDITVTGTAVSGGGGGGGDDGGGDAGGGCSTGLLGASSWAMLVLLGLVVAAAGRRRARA